MALQRAMKENYIPRYGMVLERYIDQPKSKDNIIYIYSAE